MVICFLEDENRYNAGRGSHLTLKRAEKARGLVCKLPGIYDLDWFFVSHVVCYWTFDHLNDTNSNTTLLFYALMFVLFACSNGRGFNFKNCIMGKGQRHRVHI